MGDGDPILSRAEFVLVEGCSIRVDEIAVVCAGGCAVLLRGGRKVSFRYNHADDIHRALEARARWRAAGDTE